MSNWYRIEAQAYRLCRLQFQIEADNVAEAVLRVRSMAKEYDDFWDDAEIDPDVDASSPTFFPVLGT